MPSINLAPTFGVGYQAFTTDGLPLNGGLLNTYLAGTSTPQPTYTTSGGTIANANPIVCGTDGRPQSGGNIVEIWLTAGVAYKFVLTDSLSNIIATYDNIIGINDIAATSSTTEWIATNLTPTFISTTSFSFVGNQTGTFPVGIRTKSTNTGGTIYSNVFSATYAAGPNTTTIVVTNDSGVIDSGISAVSYSNLRSDNESLPPYNTLLPVLADNVDPTKRVAFNVSSVTTATIRTLIVQNRNGTLALSGDANVVGNARKAAMNVTTLSSTTATYTADEVTLEATLGGNALTIASVSLPINLATSGLGGMVTGLAPASGFVSLYAISSTVSNNIVACNTVSSATSVYSGSVALPAGYNYSALVGIVPTDVSRAFSPGCVLDRKWNYRVFAQIFAGSAAITTLTSQTITSQVPTLARTVTLWVGNQTSGAAQMMAAAADSTGTGGKILLVAATAAQTAIGGQNVFAQGFLPDIPLITAQTVFVAVNGGASNNAAVSDYTW